MADQLLSIELHGSHALSADVIHSIVERALAIVGLDGQQSDVGIHFVDDARIRDLNRVHRGADAATDVLSFPIDSVDELPSGVSRQLGDVFVCVAYVRTQVAGGTHMAGEDTTVDQALRRCIAHGMLHLLGFDHDDDARAAAMFAREQNILDQVAERV
jgi:probable rRNA maturation factor